MKMWTLNVVIENLSSAGLQCFMYVLFVYVQSKKCPQSRRIFAPIDKVHSIFTSDGKVKRANSFCEFGKWSCSSHSNEIFASCGRNLWGRYLLFPNQTMLVSKWLNVELPYFRTSSYNNQIFAIFYANSQLNSLFLTYSYFLFVESTDLNETQMVNLILNNFFLINEKKSNVVLRVKLIL